MGSDGSRSSKNPRPRDPEPSLPPSPAGRRATDTGGRVRLRAGPVVGPGGQERPDGRDSRVVASSRRSPRLSRPRSRSFSRSVSPILRPMSAMPTSTGSSAFSRSTRTSSSFRSEVSLLRTTRNAGPISRSESDRPPAAPGRRSRSASPPNPILRGRGRCFGLSRKIRKRRRISTRSSSRAPRRGSRRASRRPLPG